MKLALMFNGEVKEFRTRFISGRMFRKAINLQKKLQAGGVSEDSVLDEMVTFCVEAFSNQFTDDEFYDGVESKEMTNILFNTILYCINGTTPINSKTYEVSNNTQQ